MLELAVVKLPEGLTRARGPGHAATASPTPSKPVAPVATILATWAAGVNDEMAPARIPPNSLKRCARAAYFCYLHAVSSAPLRLVERAVRGGKERVATLGAGGVRGDPERGGDIDLAGAEPYRLRAQQGAQPLRDLARPSEICLRKEDGHLLTAVARAEIDVGPKRTAEHPCCVPQDSVTRVVAMLVVHALEVVEVRDEERHRPLEPIAFR